MPGPAPTYQPTFTSEQLADCERLVRQHSAPQLQVARAKLALLLHDDPTMDHPAAATTERSYALGEERSQ